MFFVYSKKYEILWYFNFEWTITCIISTLDEPLVEINWMNQCPGLSLTQRSFYIIISLPASPGSRIQEPVQAQAAPAEVFEPHLPRVG
jgi:hypothetical protein